MKRLFSTMIAVLLVSVTMFAKDWTALTLGTPVDVPNGETNWSVTADKDGTLVLKAAEGGYWVNSLTVFSDAEGMNEIPMESDMSGAKLSAKAGSTYYITFWNYDGQTGSLVATVEEAGANNYPALQLGEVFTIKNFGDDVWTYTATETGTVKIVGDNGDGDYIGGCLVVYSDAAQTNQVQIYNNMYYEFPVEAGKTYYIVNWNMAGQDFKGHLTMGADKFALVDVVPATDTPFAITSDNSAVFTFTSSSVTFTEGEIAANGNIIKIYNFDNYNDLVADGTFTYTEEGTSGVVNYNGAVLANTNNGISVSLTTATGHGYYNVLNKLFEEGKLAAGDKITISLHGIKNTMTDELLNGDGNVEVSWTFAGAPTTLVSHAVPETILSWYNDGDAAGVATFTFSKAIQSAKAMLIMGMGEGADDLYEEQIADDHIIIEGSTVKVDLSGVMRTNKTMGLKMNWPTFTLKLYQVVDEAGVPTLSEDLGSDSSYSFSANYKDITAVLTSEITPATGTELTADNKSVEIWIGNADLITFDGVSILYYTMTEVLDVDAEGNPVTTMQNVAHETLVEKEKLNIQTTADGTTILCPLPEGIYEAKNIRVSLNITGSTDGQEHVVAAYYNTTLEYGLDIAATASPANESTVSRLSEIFLPLDFVYSINDKIANPVTVNSKTSSFTCGGQIVADGMMQAKIVLEKPITEEGSYAVTVAANVIGDYSYGESGFNSGTTHEAFTLNYTVDGKYAGKSVVCEPNDGETVASLSDFNVTFFDYASVAPTYDMDKTPYVEDAAGIKFPVDFIVDGESEESNTLLVRLAAPITTDGTYTLVLPGGSVCNGANGDPITTEYKFTYTVVGSAVTTAPVVTPAEGEVTELSTFTVTFDKAVKGMTENWDIEYPSVSDANGVTNGADCVPGANMGEIVITLFEKITNPGTYTLTIPAGSVDFIDGTSCEAYTFTYTVVEGGDTPANPTTTPAEGTVTEIASVTINFGKAVQGVTEDFFSLPFAEDTAFGFYDGSFAVGTAEGEVVWTPLETITGAGTYTLTLPAGCVIFADGTTSPAYQFTYTIEGGDTPGGGETPEVKQPLITPEDGSTLESLQTFELTFEGWNSWGNTDFEFPTIKNEAGDVVATAWTGLEMNEKGWNVATITFEEAVTAEGKYTLTVPVKLIDDAWVETPATFTFTYTVGDNATGIQSVTVTMNGNTYTLDGKKANAITKSGIYVIDGKKVYIRK